MHRFPTESTAEEFNQGRHGMTLFSLLVTIAAVAPFAVIPAKRNEWGIAGVAIGLCLASIFGVIQFVAHHRVAASLYRAVEKSRLVVPVFLLYYLRIPVVGALCTANTIWLTQYSLKLFALAGD